MLPFSSESFMFLNQQILDMPPIYFLQITRKQHFIRTVKYLMCRVLIQLEAEHYIDKLPYFSLLWPRFNCSVSTYLTQACYSLKINLDQSQCLCKYSTSQNVFIRCRTGDHCRRDHCLNTPVQVEVYHIYKMCSLSFLSKIIRWNTLNQSFINFITWFEQFIL